MKERTAAIAIGLVLLTSGLALSFAQHKIPTIMTGLMDLFDMSVVTATWLMSSFSLSTTIMAVPAGSLSSRFGSKRMIIVGLMLAASGSLMGIVAGEFMSGFIPLLMLSRVIEGAALAIVTTCGPVLIRQSVRPEYLGTSMGVWGVWGSLGACVAAVVVPMLFSTGGFVGLWSVFALVVLASAAIVMLFARGPEKAYADCEESVILDGHHNLSEQEVPSGSLIKPRYRELLTSDMAKFFVGFLIFNICLIAIPSFVPTFLQLRGMDASFTGFVSTVPMLISIVASPAYGALSDRLGRRKPLLVLEMLVMGPCTCIMFLFAGPVLAVAVFLMGAVSMGAPGVILSMYSTLIPRPELASMAMGVLVLVQGLGQFLGTFLVQLLLGPDLSNTLLAGIVLMLLCFVAAASFALCRAK